MTVFGHLTNLKVFYLLAVEMVECTYVGFVRNLKLMVFLVSLL